jgi:phosphorylcholine metabolism protein LicD
MTLKPKSIYCHYKDSILINSSSLKSFLLSHSVSPEESEEIIHTLSYYYNQKIDEILKIYNEDDKWATLESFPSPLILFVSCIDETFINNKVILSKESQRILKSFLKSLEPWMIW